MRTEDMRNMIVAAGGSVDDLPDNLPSTLRKRLIETMGGNCPEGNLPSDICNAFGSCGGGAQNVVYGEVSNANIYARADSLAQYVTELVVPEGVTTMWKVSHNDGQAAFVDFPNLKKLTLPASLMNNGSGNLLSDSDTFSPLKNLELVLAHGSTRIWGEAFGWSSLSKISIPDTLTDIGAYAFYDSTLSEIELPSSVETIDAEAFMYSALKKITIHKPENSIPGAPWGATNATVIWTG